MTNFAFRHFLAKGSATPLFLYQEMRILFRLGPLVVGWKKEKGKGGSGGAGRSGKIGRLPVSARERDLRVLMAEINKARKDRGLPVLKRNRALMKAAEIQAEQMVRANKMAHDLPGTPYPLLEDRVKVAGYRYRSATENLGEGFKDPRSLVRGWLDSPGHRANLLDREVSEVGVGIAADASRWPYVAAVFGAPY